MAWVVTLQITDCDTGEKLVGAFVTDGVETAYSDAYGQVIVYINDAYSSYTVQVGKLGGHLTRNFAIVRATMEGTTQTVCLNPIEEDTGGGGTSDGW